VDFQRGLCPRGYRGELILVGHVIDHLMKLSRMLILNLLINSFGKAQHLIPVHAVEITHRSSSAHVMSCGISSIIGV
jgi:hypothetical protein